MADRARFICGCAARGNVSLTTPTGTTILFSQPSISSAKTAQSIEVLRHERIRRCTVQVRLIADRQSRPANARACREMAGGHSRDQQRTREIIRPRLRSPLLRSSIVRWSTIFSESRHPLFRIML
jgi:hypothetical protein